jgi:hypothetical protein
MSSLPGRESKTQKEKEGTEDREEEEEEEDVVVESLRRCQNEIQNVRWHTNEMVV